MGKGIHRLAEVRGMFSEIDWVSEDSPLLHQSFAKLIPSPLNRTNSLQSLLLLLTPMLSLMV